MASWARVLQPVHLVTAIAGAAVLLLIYHLFTSRSSRSRGRSRRYARR
jgi:hypothetical protein